MAIGMMVVEVGQAVAAPERAPAGKPAVAGKPASTQATSPAKAGQPATAEAAGTATAAGAAASGGTPGERRIALVVGNGRYKDSPLTNPVNDARGIAQILGEAGFEVTRLEDADQRRLQIAVRSFGEALKGGGVGLFYYAGHGMQVKGRNYLVPVDAQIQHEDEVAYNALDVGQVLDKMESAGNRLNIVILDACRNNPFARSFRSSQSGLAQMDAPVGTLIAFATAPGSVASDGGDGNGLYTRHLLRSLRTPGLKIEEVFKSVRAAVRRDSGNKQVPWESTSLEGEFVFLPQANTAMANPSALAVLPPQTLGLPVDRQTSASGAAGTVDKVITSVRPTGLPIARIDKPTLGVGDDFHYRVLDQSTGLVVDTYRLRLNEVTDTEWRFGGYVTDHALNVLRKSKGGTVTSTTTPRRPYFDFPLHAGKTWTATARTETPRATTDDEFSFRVLGQEQVQTGAGRFDTLKVEGESRYRTTMKKDLSMGQGRRTVRYWFSPEVGNIVALEYEETNWNGVVVTRERAELLAFSRTRR